MYQSKSLSKYIDDLAAKLPAPGGGSAAALSASLGASLISMVIQFSLKNPRYSQYRRVLKEILKKSESSRKELLELVDLDIIAYTSKDIRAALAVPLRVCRICFELVRMCPELIGKSNVFLISDAVIAVIFLEGAFLSSFFNVDTNLRVLKDKKLSGRLKKELKAKHAIIKRIRKITEDTVGKVIGR